MVIIEMLAPGGLKTSAFSDSIKRVFFLVVTGMVSRTKGMDALPSSSH